VRYPVGVSDTLAHLHRRDSQLEVRLHCWGRSVSQWWALVTWSQPVREPRSHTELLDCAAWVPGPDLRLPPGSDGAPLLPRIHLPANRLDWPRTGLPHNWNGWWLGPWETGAATLPDGLQISDDLDNAYAS
jgi:hypothetical protein